MIDSVKDNEQGQGLGTSIMNVWMEADILSISKGNQLDFGARIMAVADIAGALTEDRPYRAGFGKQEGYEYAQEQVNNNLIDGDVVIVVLGNHFDEIIYSTAENKSVV